MRQVTPVAALLVAVSVALLTLPGCGQTSEAASQTTELRVFAAASLTSAFTELGERYAAEHPDVKTVFNFAGSQDLIGQIEQGAVADVLATADTTTMEKAAEAVTAPSVFAGNRLAIAVEPGNPLGLTGLADLGRGDLKVVLAAPDVPAGAYARQILQTQSVSVKPVSLEVTVKGVVTKVAMGEADAGIVYVTDISAAGGEVEEVAIPDDQNVVAVYPIAVADATSHKAEAQSFVDYVLSPEGQQIMARYGFLPPSTTQ